jgi:hypothetical protein
MHACQRLSVLVSATLLAAVAPAAAQTYLCFEHVGNPSNIVDNYTLLDHPALNGNPNAVVLATEVWNPPGGTPLYHATPIGVWYSGVDGRWSVYYEDWGVPMPDEATFSICAVTANPDAFVHTATVANSEYNYTYLDHPDLNGHPDAVVMVTHCWNPGGGGSGTYDPSPLGVWYDSYFGQWSVFNQDLSSMVVGTAFNVLGVTAGGEAFVHAATPGNVSYGLTLIDHTVINGNAGALLLVTPNWNPGGVGGTYHNHPVGVWYGGQWAVYNADAAVMEAGPSFNVLVPPMFVDGFESSSTSAWSSSVPN